MAVYPRTEVVVLVVMVPPIVLVLIARLLYPPDVKGVDLEAYYYRQAPLLWGLVVVARSRGPSSSRSSSTSASSTSRTSRASP